MGVFIFSTTLSQTFLILRRLRRDIIINVHTSSYKIARYSWRIFLWNLNFLDRSSKSAEILNFLKIRPLGAELFHRTDSHDEAKNLFS